MMMMMMKKKEKKKKGKMDMLSVEKTRECTRIYIGSFRSNREIDRSRGKREIISIHVPRNS